MSTLPTFVNGQEGSAGQFMAALQSLYDTGSENLSTLTSIREETLISLQHRLSYLNSKQQEANRLAGQNSLVNFSLANFFNIDQSETTATVRIDTNVATTAERDVEVEAIIKSIVFTTSVGSIDVLNTASNIYRVYNTNNQTPVGTFFITLRDSINLSVLVFDLPSIASNPVINVSVSETNVLYTQAVSYSLNGYRLIVYLEPGEIQYIKLSITPSQPDNLGGTLYTFGITDFVGNSTQYRLLSEFVSKPISFVPNSLNCQLSGTIYPGLVYFLSLDGQNYSEIDLNVPVPIPGTSLVTLPAVTLNQTGLLNTPIDPSYYSSTLQVIDNTTQLAVPVIYNLLPTDSTISKLSNSYISKVGNLLYYLPYETSDSTKTFTVSYIKGPLSVSAQLKVLMSTDDKNLSPIFNGVALIAA